MEDKVQGLLDEVIETELLKLSEYEPDSEDKSKAIKDVSELYKLRIEEAKIKQVEAQANAEAEAKQKQAKSQNLDRWINLGVQIGLGIAGIVAYDVWYRRGLRFEETGTITSPMTRNLLSRMLPRK